MKFYKKPSFYCSLVSLIALLFLFFQLKRLNVLPTKYFGILLVIALIVVAVIFLLALNKRIVLTIIGSVLALAMTITSVFASYYVMSTNGALNKITETSNKEKHTVILYALKTSPLKDYNGLDGQSIGILENNSKTYVDKGLSEIKKEGKSFNTQNYNSIIQLVNDFKGQKIDLIMIDSSNIAVIEDMENQENFSDEIKELYTYTYYVKKSNTADATDVSLETFTILISGSDSRGSIDEVSRSDVDLLMTINPVTHQILMTSIPRDYYITTVCSEGMGCANGQKDKLTHTGLHGVETTEMTIENLLDIDINYNVKVGFETLTQLVDTLGGITVNNPQEFTAQGYTFVAGNIDLNGQQALAFSRERYSFESGDRERGRNQIRVLTGILNKVMSPSILSNYASIMNSLSSTFHTNMSMDDISTLVKSQLDSMSSWQFYSYSLNGNGGQEYCYELGDEASVVYPDDTSISEFKTDMNAISLGETPPYTVSQS